MAERGTLLIAAMLAVWTASAHAQTLDVQGDGCIDEPAIRSALQGYARSAESARDASMLSTRVWSEGDSVSFRVMRARSVVAERRFDWRDPDGTVRVPSCEARLRALSLALSLALENAQRQAERGNAGAQAAATTSDGASVETSAPSARAEAPTKAPATPEAPNAAEQEPTTPADATPSTAEDTAPAEAVEDQEAGRSTLALRLELGAGLLIGVVPEPALLGTLGAELDVLPQLTFALAVLGTLPTRSALPGGEVDAHVLGGRASGCLARPLGALRTSGCIGVVAGVVQARGVGFDVRDARADLGWLSFTAGVALDLPLFDAFSLRAALGAGLALLRPELRVLTPSMSTRVAHTSAPVNASASLSFLWALR
jgi:hypothetical protein